MADTDKLIQIAAFTLTMTTVVVIAFRAYWAERRELEERNQIETDFCPHCGAAMPSELLDSPPTAAAQHTAVREENVIRPAAWSAQQRPTVRSVLRRLLGLSGDHRRTKPAKVHDHRHASR